MELFVLKPCRTGRDYELHPRKKMEVDLKGAAALLSRAGFEVELATPLVLFLRLGVVGLALYKSGRVLVRGAGSEQAAGEIGRRLYSSLAG
ncbi:MAG: hypothetical protein QXH27_00625 [Candidatus Micrarchaeia archaeon]